MTDSYSQIKFQGIFREYQQRVLDNSKEYLSNEKIHIVAAPGSGKTILGLELIRRLNKPALILSPTIAIREQWKERFIEKFADKEIDIEKFFSVSLTEPRLITSITYQGLYTSYEKTRKFVKDDEIQDTEQEDYSVVNIIKLINEKKIGTICLDEAHHLRWEWQKALYNFIKEIEHDVTIIALTATPPYDSKKMEWDKYIEICGEIDDEIFVPPLVKSKTLCSHQDYIYYNYPAQDELKAIKEYKDKATEALTRAITEEYLLQIIINSDFYKNPVENCHKLLDKPLLLKAILAFLTLSKRTENRKLFALLKRFEQHNRFSLSVAECLLQGMMTDEELFNKTDREHVKKFLMSYSLIEKNKVSLINNSKLDKLIISSAGKLNSIKQIVDLEWENLGDDIRLVILTDYIKDNSSVLGSDRSINEMGVIPIFELLRRNTTLKLAALSGRIIIIPNVAAIDIKSLADKENVSVKLIPIVNTEHSEIRFESARNSQKISVITKAFNEGLINGIVGTKSLLGEGWDSPVINTLILASFVGSFVLSNQMRGRAIRIDPKLPNKVSNIWHLTTILPEYLSLENKCIKFINKSFKITNFEAYTPLSTDYDILSKRFITFIGLSYKEDIIENGIDRVSLLTPPYNEKCVAEANEKTFMLARDREGVYNGWQRALEKATDEIVIEKEQKQPVLHNKFLYINALALVILTVLSANLGRYFFEALWLQRGLFPGLLYVLVISSSLYFIIKRLLLLLSPYRIFLRIARAVLLTFFELRIISNSAILDIVENKKNFAISIGIKNCSNYEKNIFYNAMATLFNPIENPRYLLIRKRLLSDYSTSFAVPEVFAINKKNAEAFRKNISRHLMKFTLCYTRSREGRIILNKCRRRSFISFNYVQMYGRKRLLSKWE